MLTRRRDRVEAGVAGFHDFGGLHCETASLAKLFRHHGLDYSEELLFGLGGGIGFIYWKTRRMPTPFIGGRNGKFPGFVERIGMRLGHDVRVVTTGSPGRAEERLASELGEGRPVVCYGDIHYLPYFGTDRHFGGHAFLVYAVDWGRGLAAISDRCAGARWIGLDDLARARGSRHHPFPPRHAMLRVEVRPGARVLPASVRSSLAASREAMVAPPISNLGLSGLRKLASELRRWPADLGPRGMVERMISLYVDLEIAGTGGCAFRRMYRRFLEEAQEILGEDLGRPIARLDEAIDRWRALLDTLLSDREPAFGAIRSHLHLRDETFLRDRCDPDDRAAGAATWPSLLAAAADRLVRCPGLLGGLPEALMAIADAEQVFQDTLSPYVGRESP